MSKNIQFNGTGGRGGAVKSEELNEGWGGRKRERAEELGGRFNISTFSRLKYVNTTIKQT